MKQPKLFNYLVGYYNPNGELVAVDTGDGSDRISFGTRKEANFRLKYAVTTYPDNKWEVVRIPTKRQKDW